MTFHRRFFRYVSDMYKMTVMLYLTCFIFAFSEGTPAVTTPKEIVEEILLETIIHPHVNAGNKNKTETYRDSQISGKFYKAMFNIQNTAASEFSLERFRPNISYEERLTNLTEYFNIAVSGGSIAFARETLGRSLYTIAKIHLDNGSSLQDINHNSVRHLLNMKSSIGEENWRTVTALGNTTSLVYVVDTTGSMYHEIKGGQEIAKNVIEKMTNLELDYILSPFNDPDIGPVIHRASNESDKFLTDLSKLYPKGGRDCPELTFSGMIKTFEAEPKYGSPLFVFTDATAKDDTKENVAMLKALAKQHDSAIYFFTSKDGCTGGDKRGIQSYREIANYTNGKVFSIVTRNDLEKYSEVVSNILQENTLITSGKTIAKKRVIKDRSKRALIEELEPTKFVLDEKLTRVELEIEVSSALSLPHIKVKDPEDVAHVHHKVIGLVKYYNIDNPKAGNWALHFPDIQGTYAYSISAMTTYSLETGYQFVIKDPETKSVVPSDDPIKDQDNQMLVNVGGHERVNLEKTRVDIVDRNGRDLLSDIPARPLSGGMLEASFRPPNNNFRVRLRGETFSGAPFERTSNGFSNPTNRIIRPIQCGQDFTVRTGETSIDIIFQVVMPSSSYQVRYQSVGKAYLGYVYGEDSKDIRYSEMLKLKYNAPRWVSRPGMTDQITVRVCPDRCHEDERINSWNNYSHTFTVLIL